MHGICSAPRCANDADIVCPNCKQSACRIDCRAAVRPGPRNQDERLDAHGVFHLDGQHERQKAFVVTNNRTGARRGAASANHRFGRKSVVAEVRFRVTLTLFGRERQERPFDMASRMVENGYTDEVQLNTHPYLKNASLTEKIVLLALSCIGVATVVHFFAHDGSSSTEEPKPDTLKSFNSPAGQYQAVRLTWAGGGGLSPYCNQT